MIWEFKSSNLECSGRIHEFYYNPLDFYEARKQTGAWNLPWYYPPLIFQLNVGSLATLNGWVNGQSMAALTDRLQDE